jgi:hypothetical protein
MNSTETNQINNINYSSPIKELEKKYRIELLRCSEPMALLKNLPKDFFIDVIGHLPKIIMETIYGIKIDWEGEDRMLFDLISKEFQEKAKWLKFHLSEGDEEECLETYKSISEISVAWFNLAKQVQVYSPSFKYKYAPRPIVMLLFLEWELCILMLEKSGFTGEALPIGKSKSYSEIRTVSTTFLNVNKFKLTRGILTSPREILLNEAIIIARERTKYKFRRHYEMFFKELKEIYRELRDCKLTHFCYFDGEVLRTIGIGQRGKAAN